MAQERVTLTIQELRILDRLAKGWNYKEIMHELIIGRTAIAVALRVIRGKLGAETTTQAVAIAVYKRLIFPLDGEPSEFKKPATERGK